MNTDFKNSDDYCKLIQSQKEGLEEMSKHEPNCPKSGDVMEDCTCPQQSTVEERFKRFLEQFDADFLYRSMTDQDIISLFSKMTYFYESELQLAEQKAREDIRDEITKRAEESEGVRFNTFVEVLAIINQITNS